MTIFIAYSGHAYVAIESAASSGIEFNAYCDKEEKDHNPYELRYLGRESESILENTQWFIGVGNNNLKKNLY